MKYNVLAIDVWAGDEEGDWHKNNFFVIGELAFDETPTCEELVKALIDEGHLTELALELAVVVNHDCEGSYYEVVELDTNKPVLDVRRISV